MRKLLLKLSEWFFVFMYPKKFFLPAVLLAFLFYPNAALANQAGNRFLKDACISILKNLLFKPQTLQISAIKYSKHSNTNPDTLGAILVDYSAKNKSGLIVDERAYCELTDRATVSIMSGARRNFSHLK
ncbi:MAG: Uncharacterised protein [Prochlorococcus marinus str. MIT 9215]|nr:MAG: Uncharacterised protein [Prochlorococcus marinus str. MIT 9215]